MDLETSHYAAQLATLPIAGRPITAQFDAETILVYQAYCPQIAEFALQHNCFGDGFSYGRMSWIKPSFLWMMHRSQGPSGREPRDRAGPPTPGSFFEDLFRQAVLTPYDSRWGDTHDDWRMVVRNAEVLVQRDPDRLPGGGRSQRQAIQVGTNKKSSPYATRTYGDTC